MSEIAHKFEASDVTNGDVSAKEITIYGDIGDFWWDSTSANDVKRVLKDSPESDVIVNLNTPGGDVFEGIAIYNILKSHKGHVTINIDGWAASAGSIIAMAGDVINMRIGTILMIHEAWTVAMGSKRDISSTLNALETIDTSLADIYMTRFKGERNEVEKFIENETWFSASDAIAFGFADSEIEEGETDPEEFKNSVLARFKTKQKDPDGKGILNTFKRP